MNMANYRSDFSSIFDHLQFIRLIRHQAQESKIFISIVPVPVRHSRGDEHGIALLDSVHLAADSYFGMPAQDVLLVLNGIGVVRDATPRLNGEASHGEVGGAVGTDQNLDKGPFASFDRLPGNAR